MKYNVGDRVLIQSREWYEANKNIFGKVWTKDLTGDGVICFDHDMAEYCGQEFIIETIEDDCYALRDVPYAWTDEMFEDVECQGFAFRLPEDLRNERLVVTRQHGYEFRDENGKVINASKIVLEKKKEYTKGTKVRHKTKGMVETVVGLCKIKYMGAWVDGVIYEGNDTDTGEPTTFVRIKEDFENNFEVL